MNSVIVWPNLILFLIVFLGVPIYFIFRMETISRRLVRIEKHLHDRERRAIKADNEKTLRESEAE